MMFTDAHVAIRKAEDTDKDTHDGYEYFDFTTMSRDLGMSKGKAAGTDAACGAAWAKANPIVRFAMVRVEEVG